MEAVNDIDARGCATPAHTAMLRARDSARGSTDEGSERSRLNAANTGNQGVGGARPRRP
jgi:hypothetical protein